MEYLKIFYKIFVIFKNNFLFLQCNQIKIIMTASKLGKAFKKFQWISLYVIFAYFIIRILSN
jgi:hypothetical protein